ncbi:MAG TPA: 4'-phosphopantetheinyl transferase superfamily protein [bacterium]|nr:4'-phosphopantetheinyl transferase superfamily protein [bacterium]
MDPGEIQLWTADLDLEKSTLETLGQALSPDELERANRFLREADRRRFTAARGILRRLAANYLAVGPAELRFSYGAKGKPALVDGAGLGFSMSHCQGRALYAFTWGRELGVDLELLREDLDAVGVAERYFNSEEAASLRAMPASDRQREFFRLWTVKEAYAKALGIGLGVLQAKVHEDPRFRVEEIRLGADEFAALAYSGEKADARLFNFAMS